MINIIPPFVFFIGGAFLIPFLKGKLRTIYMLFLPKQSFKEAVKMNCKDYVVARTNFVIQIIGLFWFGTTKHVLDWECRQR